MPETPPRPHRPRRLLLLAGLGLLAIALGFGAFAYLRRDRTPSLPEPGDPVYEEYVEAFGVGLAGLDVEVGEEAEKNLSRAVALIPQEPAGWADRGLFYLRTRQLPQAARDLAEAERLAPDAPGVQKLLGLLEDRNGRYPEAAERFRRAAASDPGDVELLYALAGVVDKAQAPGADAEYQRLMEQILAVRPDNLHVLLERLRVAARRSDRAAVDDTLARFRRLAPNWDAQAREVFAEAEKALAGPLGGEVLAVLSLSNILKAEPGYARGSGEVNPADTEAGRPLRTFLRLAPARNAPAPPDADLTLTPEPLPAAPPGRWTTAAAVWPTPDGPPTLAVANEQGAKLVGVEAPLPSSPVATAGLVPLDWNNDFRTDLLLAGPGGLRFYERGETGAYADVTGKTKLPADVLTGDYAAALAADVDLDGDLDLLVARRAGPPLFLRNNFDGTFAAVPVFPGVDGVRAFAWADFDHDGAPDAALLDAAGRLHVFANERSGRFVPWPAPLPTDRFLAVAVADVDEDGALDIVALRADGAVVGLADRNKRARWEAVELARWEPPAGAEPGAVRLLVADLDNNGVPDLIASGPAGGAVWLGAGGGKFQQLAATVRARVFATVDFGATGRVDLLGLDADGRPTRVRTVGAKNYHWQSVRFRAQPGNQVQGDNRINSYGIGGEVEVRTGTLVVKRPIDAPAVHVGLGDRTRADVLRVQWPNGQAQVEFRPPVDGTFAPLQRLKGSCPFLFAWNGERFAFVADFMWSTPLGMYINAQDKGGLLQTAEWVKVRGDQLAPRDGFYDVRAQANLWETHYFDHLALHAVDHPAGTELFVDERFALEPSKPTAHLTGPTRPVARAWDYHGGDATEAVRAADGVYLDRCGRGPYQGITADHWVEVDLGDDAPRSGPVYLVARGWVHPTDSSINYALEQGTNPRPRGLVLEVPDDRGGWKAARDWIGFPAGKNKTILLRLDGLDGPGVARRFRLRTNMEIFWDSLHYAEGRDEGEIRTRVLAPTAADLRPRGILAMSQANPSSPELPDYDRVVARGPVWRDLIGFHTRFGDVRELLDRVDDRYAILTAGDEIALRFAAPPGPPPGWTRDFVWASDGWVKDGDLNTRWGKTVLPLPSHGMAGYDTPPGRLTDDPVFRRFRKDWDVFHTRYVTPAAFERGLRGPVRSER